MKFTTNKIYILIALCFCFSLSVWGQTAATATNEAISTDASVAAAGDSTLLFPITKNYSEHIDDLDDESAMNIGVPDNVKSEVQYDPETGKFFFISKVAGDKMGTPFYMTEEEYIEYSTKQSMQEYYAAKIKEEEANKHKFSLTDVKIDIGSADKVFGPGGIQVKMQGSAELIFGLNFKKIKDPSLSERAQNPPPTFDFDEKIQLNVAGSVGDKLSFGLNYNTESTFDFDQSLITLKYEGKEDDIIKKIEAGNVSMPLTGTLITGSTSLFGIKTDLQFGKLSVSAVVSQQESSVQSVNTSGAQTTDYKIAIDEYDENRHFFLSHYFYDNYDEWVKDVPNIASGISITAVEVWVTNKNTVNYDDVTNIVGFVDLAEPSVIYNPSFSPTGTSQVPSNTANTLYPDIVQSRGGLPPIYEIDATLAPYNMVNTVDYATLEGARKLEPSEFTLNKTLGYISLKSSLNSDEILAVAYQFTYRGQVYTVGEMSNAQVDRSKPLALKLLKTTETSPALPTWRLMMKNIYALGAYQVQESKFRMNVMYQNDSTGIDLRYISEGAIANKPLLWVLGLDHLDSHHNEKPNGDGIFDFVDGYSIIAQNGKIIFPSVEPFGKYLAKKLNNDPRLVEKYVFQELYDSTLVAARELAEKNKFYLEGEYKASSGSEIRLDAMNVPQGSVKVTAGGVVLTENVDYTVDYMMGVVTIMNQNLIDLGTPINVTLESQSMFNMQRKSLIGAHFDYAFTENFNVGATIMYLSEKPLTTTVNYGADPVANTVWGLNVSYREQFQSITDWLNKLSIFNLKQASSLAIDAEFAHMIPGTAPGANGRVYIDDFESTAIGYDVRYANNWKLASTPASFAEGELSNNIEYGKNRALLAWYYIDNLFNQNTSYTPQHIREDKDQLSNHFVRQITEQEIFPNKELAYGTSSYIQTLDLAFYPKERGPYNIYTNSYGADGYLTSPESKWGGIMRKLETTDFETNNIEYLEFWLMDPFVYNTTGTMQGGDLYINLGDISEDILKDGRKAYENGLPVDGELSTITETVWGKVSTKQSVNYAFDATEQARPIQDAGLNGLLTSEEQQFGAYASFVSNLRTRLTPDAVARMEADAFSPLNDPAGDNFHHYRGSDYDAAEVSVLNRYKYFNGTEANSQIRNDNESYTTAATNNPDVEDINSDNTMNSAEKYFEYRISLRPGDMVVGTNFITNKVTSSVTLKNGETGTVNWYQFKIPLRDPDAYRTQGSIRSFRSIRFMRMYLNSFKENVNLRFATMKLVKGEWRTYNQTVDEDYHSETAILETSSVSIEEDADKTPVNYVLPPGVIREIDPSQQQVRQENEQSLSIKVLNLAPKDARAIYKKMSGYDMRQYGKMEMFTHAEALVDDVTDLGDRDLKLFIRMGSDYKNNYYEYEVPLTLTPEGIYSTNNNADREIVWPEDNKIELPLEYLTKLKTARNTEKVRPGSSVTNLTPYSMVDPEKPNNRLTIVGNPSLGDVEVFMIGVRNGTRTEKSAEIWVDELLLTEFDQEGGVAARASVDFSLSDFVNINASGHIETIGYGGIEQKVQERRQDDYYQYNVNASIDLGKLLPEKANVIMPVKYSLSQEIINPKYNPLDKDLLLSESLAAAPDKQARDSILNIAQDRTTTQSLSIPSIRVGITSEKGPRPWDPANFTVGGSYSKSISQDPNTTREVDMYTTVYGSYEFNWSPKLVQPLGKVQKLKRSKNWRWMSDWGFYYAPKRVSYKTDFTRNYYEQVIRDYENQGAVQYIEPSFAKDFMWNNYFDFAWDLTKSIKLTLTTANRSLITENDGGVDSELYPDEYQAWKDSVWKSLSELGSPQDYSQRFTASWAVPLNKIPVLRWVTGNLKYEGTYNWAYGSEIINNTAISNGTWSADGKLNFLALYNRSKYLKGVNSKYGSSRNVPKKKKPKTFAKELNVSKGDTITINHRLNNKKIKVTAIDANGKKYKLKHKVINPNQISFIAKKDADLELTVSTADNSADNVALDLTARFLMMIRNVAFSYSQTDGTVLPGFKPSVTCLGLTDFNGRTAPGWDFVFGIQDENMLQRALDNDWLNRSDAIYNPAEFIHTETFKATALIEPIPGLKINLGVDRQYVKNKETNFTSANLLNSINGSFSMTYVAIGTMFSGMGPNHESELFTNFINYRNTIKSRLEAKYSPETGYAINSDDVLIPAFLAAYSGRDVNNIDLGLIPSFWSFLPNWQVSYDGLMRIPWIKRNLRSVNLTHGYNCKYQIGSFVSDQTFNPVIGDEFGYIDNPLINGGVLPSSFYDMNTVTISEQFSPLIGVDVNLKNSLSVKAEYRKGRIMAMNLSSNQLVETYNNEVVVGLGYKFTDLSFGVKQGNNVKKVSNDLTLRADFSIKDAQTLVRKIELLETQATAGDWVSTFKFLANYVYSERLSFSLFYDMQLRVPVVSTSYATSIHEVGISAKILLTR